MSEPNREKEIFGQALELSSLEGRAAFVAGACAGDESLRERVHALLRASGAPTAFLPKTPRPTPAARDEEAVDAAGTVIGRYRLLERIGEGGFGVVYLAEQLEPVRRRVALKVIKPGMDSRQVIARFEAERQALALMDHPNIAQILDAGTIGSAEAEIANPNAQLSQGRPYFVMELINGIPITKFCEEQQLDLEARLRLFIEVCFAVQHAHQKGVIHRDLKPSNILVTRHGERLVPKVIDFGIAKAMQEPLTEKTVFTQFHQFMGTPAYMSPEQAALGGLDVDTRSDIYSLGALLYELLAGGPPFDPKELLSGGLNQLRKIIGEKEPRRPSARLTQALVAAEGTSRTAGSAEAGGSSRRRLQELVRQLKSDLDWIVLKALEKDRDRRYATANGLAADLQRYLNREPVTAVAPTLGYQLAKFYWRNRKLVVTLSAFVALLLAASMVSIGLAVRAWRAEAVAEREAATALKVSEFLWKEVFKQLTPWEHTNRAVSLRGAFDLAATRIGSRLTNQPLAEASVRFSYGKAYVGMSEFASAETNLLRALDLRRNHAPQPDVQTADLLYDLGILRQFQNRPAEAERLFGEAAALREKTLGANHRETHIAAAKAALVRSGRLPREEAEPLLRHSLEQLRRFVGAEANVTLATMNWLGALWADQGRFDEAFDLFSETHRIAVRDDGVASSGALWSLELMAGTRARQGRFAEADKSFLELISVRERVNGTNHVFTLQTRLFWLERVLVPQGRLAEAAAAWLVITPRVQASQPTLQPALALTRQSLLAAWQAQGGGAECEEFQRRASVYPPAAPIEVTAPSAPDDK